MFPVMKISMKPPICTVNGCMSRRKDFKEELTHEECLHVQRGIQ